MPFYATDNPILAAAALPGHPLPAEAFRDPLFPPGFHSGQCHPSERQEFRPGPFWVGGHPIDVSQRKTDPGGEEDQFQETTDLQPKRHVLPMHPEREGADLRDLIHFQQPGQLLLRARRPEREGQQRHDDNDADPENDVLQPPGDI